MYNMTYTCTYILTYITFNTHLITGKYALLILLWCNVIMFYSSVTVMLYFVSVYLENGWGGKYFNVLPNVVYIGKGMGG